MKYVVYNLRNTITDKLYIGRAEDSEIRLMQHEVQLNTGKHYNKALQADWNRYGADAFEFSIEKTCAESDYAYYELEQIMFEHDLWRGPDNIYNVVTAKDMIVYRLASWAKKQGYQFRIDYKTEKCKDKQPLNWNIAIVNQQKKSAWVTLSSAQYPLDEKKMNIRKTFMDTSSNYMMVSFSYAPQDTQRINQIVEEMTAQITAHMEG